MVVGDLEGCIAFRMGKIFLLFYLFVAEATVFLSLFMITKTDRS